MAENNALWDELNDLLMRSQEQKNQIFESFQKLVTAVLSGSITAEGEIQALLNNLVSFTDEKRFFLLYQDMCRYVSKNRPQMVGELKNVFSMICK